MPNPRRGDLIQKLKLRQRNTVWPDTLRNGRNVDAFLWHGSSKASYIQRVGALVFGLLFITLGLATLDLAHARHSVVQLLVGLFSALLGIRISVKAFLRRKQGRVQRP